VEGFRRGCFRSKYKGFPNFLLLSVRFQCFSNLFLNCQIKTPYRPNLPLIEKRVFFCLDYFGTTFPASVIYYVRVQSSTSLITQSVSSVSPWESHLVFYSIIRWIRNVLYKSINFFSYSLYFLFLSPLKMMMRMMMNYII